MNEQISLLESLIDEALLDLKTLTDNANKRNEVERVIERWANEISGKLQKAAA